MASLAVLGGLGVWISIHRTRSGYGLFLFSWVVGLAAIITAKISASTRD